MVSGGSQFGAINFVGVRAHHKPICSARQDVGMTLADSASPDPVAVDLAAFIAAAPSPFHVTAVAAARLVAAGFSEVASADHWRVGPGGGFVRRDGTLVAWRVPEGPPERYRIVAAHTDSPNLRIKPLPDSGTIAQLGVEVYGGVLLNSWLDRDLGISGRVVLRSGSAERLFLFDEPLLRIPQLAIHLDRDVNERGLVLNRQLHLAPMWSGSSSALPFRTFLATALDESPEEIIGWDAMLHDTAKPSFLGQQREFLSAARLDNLVSCHAALGALCDAPSPGKDGLVVAMFDHEEVGSTSEHGAGGVGLASVLERLSAAR
jgi:aspartyl aminopeptidase